MIKIKTRRKKTDKQKMEAVLDELYREYIRERAMGLVGGCQRCLQPKRTYMELQTHHFQSCRKKTVRWDPQNGVGLCGGCHRHVQSNKEDNLALEIDILGQEEYERLYVQAEMTTKTAPIDHKLIELQLRELLKEVNLERDLI